MDERMQRRPSWMPWAVASLAMIVVAMLAYGAGQHEAASGATERWHWGFPGIFGFFLLFWVFGLFRWIFWGWGPHPWRYRRYARYYDDEYDDWREWHRREHERMGQTRGPDHVA